MSFASVPPKAPPPRPPDKGSFPLDHGRECSAAKDVYVQCLKQHGMQAQADECRKLSAAYLQCRMDTCAGRRRALPSRTWLSAHALDRYTPRRRPLTRQPPRAVR